MLKPGLGDRDGLRLLPRRPACWPRPTSQPRGVEVRLAPPAELAGAADGADLLWLESPSNPALEVYDIAALAARGVHDGRGQHHRRARCSSSRSSSAPTSSLTSATKQMSGHADLLLGYVTTRDAERAEALRDWRRYAGAHPRPVRDLARAPLAAHARAAAGARVRQRPGDRPAARGARRRGGACATRACRATPATRWRARQMRGYGMVVSFDLGTAERAESFLAQRQAGHRRHQLRQRAHRARSGAPAGAATRSRRASSGSPRAARRRPICLQTSNRALDAA